MQISVVVPAFNEEKFIGVCLSHLANQSRKPDEIIVVDNNCQDKTVEIAKKFGVRIVSEKNQGMAYARNKGFDEARFEIIARCDADSRPPKDWVTKIKKNFRQRNIDGLLGSVVFYDLKWPDLFAVYVYFKLGRLLLGHYPLNGPNMALTKAIWNKVRDKVCLDDKRVHEDIDLSIHLNKVGGKIYYDKSLLVPISGRRIKKRPYSFFGEYPIRFARTMLIHK